MTIAKILVFLLKCIALAATASEGGVSIIHVHTGHKLLNGQVISSTKASDLWSCVVACRKVVGCLSANVRKDGVQVYCDLIKSTRFSNGITYTEGFPSYQYLEVGWSECNEQDGWKRFKSAAYKYINEKVNLITARQRCYNMPAGADLVSIRDSEENEFVKKLFINEPAGWGLVWIGLNDIEEDTKFVWFDKTPVTYTNWYTASDPSKPPLSKSENCVGFYEAVGRNWVDISCNHLGFFVCKVACPV